MYIITLNHLLDPVVVWLDEQPTLPSPPNSGQGLLTLHTFEEARDVAHHVLQLLDEGREAALIFQPSLVM